MKKLFFGFVVALLIALPLSGMAATQPKHTWASLTPMQREALSPLASQWDSMAEKQRQRLLATTKHYPELSPKQKELYQKRLPEWSNMSQEQRDRARTNYKELRKTPEKREELKKKVAQREQPPAESSSAVSGTTPSK